MSNKTKGFLMLLPVILAAAIWQEFNLFLLVLTSLIFSINYLTKALSLITSDE